MREIVLDTETTGLESENGDRIIEIGVVELINHVSTGKIFHKYINPQITGKMPEEAYRVHGLTTEFLSDKPIFSEIIDELFDFIGDSKIVIHNAKFDIKFLNDEINRVKTDFPRIYKTLDFKEINLNRTIDTLEIAKKMYPGKSVSLDSLCLKFAIDTKKRVKHDALLDSQILSEVYLELIGGKQPGFVFQNVKKHIDIERKNPLSKRAKFNRSVKLENRLTQQELTEHKEFISNLDSNIWY
tara:strand:+ start:1132 stop:1857 length:726 start_codon:yes stop_codon:yes gene_type:complete